MPQMLAVKFRAQAFLDVVPGRTFRAFGRALGRVLWGTVNTGFLRCCHLGGRCVTQGRTGRVSNRLVFEARKLWLRWELVALGKEGAVLGDGAACGAGLR